MTTPTTGDGCYFRLTYDVNGSGRKTVEYSFTVADPTNSDSSWTYPGTLTSSVRKGQTSTVAFIMPTGEAFPNWAGGDRVVEVDWTATLFSGKKKNPEEVDSDSGSATVNVPNSGQDLPCTLG